MADKSARPVSGEIMTGHGSTTGRESDFPGADIVDAEYETIAADDGNSTARSTSPTESVSTVGLGVLRGRDGAEPGRSTLSDRGGPAFWTLGLGIVLLAFWISGGHTLIASVPFFHAEPPAPDLRIADVRSRIETADGKALLFVDGEVVNDAGDGTRMRSLAINVLDKQGRTTRYFLGTTDRSLRAGEHFGFSSRLVAPTGGVQSVSVTFREPEG